MQARSRRKCAADPLKFVWRLAHDHPGKPIAELLAASQKDWWEQSLRKPVEAELRRLTQEK